MRSYVFYLGMEQHTNKGNMTLSNGPNHIDGHLLLWFFPGPQNQRILPVRIKTIKNTTFEDHIRGKATVIQHNGEILGRSKRHVSS